MDIARLATQMWTWKLKLGKKLKRIEKCAMYNEILQITEKIYPTY